MVAVLTWSLPLYSRAADNFKGGIVYGPKAAFRIQAPKGWVLDNQAGCAQGFPCVLYPKGSSWADGDVVIYAEIMGAAITDRDAYMAEDLRMMAEKDPSLKHERVAEGKTADGCAYVINDYRRHRTSSEGNTVQIERAAYVQLPSAVALIVLISPSDELDQKNGGALEEVLKSFYAMKVKIAKSSKAL